MKYSKEFKLECIRKRKEGVYIQTPPGFKNRDRFMSQIRKWSIIYDSLGEAGLGHGKPTLDIDQRLELIRRVENGESYYSVACSAGIGSDALTKWHGIYTESGIDGLKSLKRGRRKPMENKKAGSAKKKDSDKTREELLEELQYVRAENEYLKKLRALVQERKAREQKKK